MKQRNESNRNYRNEGGTYGQDHGSQIGRSSNREFRGMDEFIDRNDGRDEGQDYRRREDRDYGSRSQWREPGSDSSRYHRAGQFDNSERYSGNQDQGFAGGYSSGSRRYQGGMTESRFGMTHREMDRSGHGEWRPGEKSGGGEFMGKGPKNYRRSDERIREDVCERLSQHGQIDASDIDVQVESGVVTLTGWVSDRRIKHLTEDICENISGVSDVHNQIRVGEAKSEETSGKSGRTETSGKKPSVAAA